MSKILDFLLILLKAAPAVIAYFAGKKKEESENLKADYDAALRAREVSRETKDMSLEELDKLARKKVKVK